MVVDDDAAETGLLMVDDGSVCSSLGSALFVVGVTSPLKRLLLLLPHLPFGFLLWGADWTRQAKSKKARNQNFDILNRYVA